MGVRFLRVGLLRLLNSPDILASLAKVQKRASELELLLESKQREQLGSQPLSMLCREGGLGAHHVNCSLQLNTVPARGLTAKHRSTMRC